MRLFHFFLLFFCSSSIITSRNSKSVFFFIPKDYIFLYIFFILTHFFVPRPHFELFSQETKVQSSLVEKRLALTSKAIASVNLHKTEFLTSKIFSNRLKSVELVTGTKLLPDNIISLRDRIIDSMIVLQAAEKKKVRANHNDVLEFLRNRISNPNATEDEIKTFFESSQLAKIQSWSEYFKNLKNENIIQNYIRLKISIDSIERPNDETIRNFYFEHKNSYNIPTTFRVSHIFFSFDNLENENKKNLLKTRTEKVLNDLNSGKYSFEELVRMHSEHHESAIRLGDLGYIHDTPGFKQILGDEFVSSLTRLRSGQTSGIITSKNGFHIIKVTERQEKKALNLSDADPNNPRSTIYQYVEQQIINAEYEKKALELIEKLRSQTKININEDIWKPFLKIPE